jgi:methionyl-tRNA formyltransferase
VKILLASSSHLGIDLLEHLQNSNHQLLGAISSPDQASGRGQSVGSNEFAAHCQRNDVVCYKPGSDQQLSEVLQQTQAELVITLAYGRLIKANELQMPKFGWLNVHFSLLPRWRGASPVQRAIAAGDRETGVTVFKLEEGLDTGPIYSTINYALDNKSRSDQVLNHLASLSIKPVNEALKMIEDGQRPTAQSGDGVTLAPKILKSEGRINWSRIQRKSRRGLEPFIPGLVLTP